METSGRLKLRNEPGSLNVSLRQGFSDFLPFILGGTGFEIAGVETGVVGSSMYISIG